MYVAQMTKPTLLECLRLLEGELAEAKRVKAELEKEAVLLRARLATGKRNALASVSRCVRRRLE